MPRASVGQALALLRDPGQVPATSRSDTWAMLDALLATLQPRRGQAWHGPITSGALRGVTAAQARWKPSPRGHSIWELALHIAYWNYAVRRHLQPVDGRFPRTPANWPAMPARADARAWAADRALLADEHAQLVRAVKRFSMTRWNRVPRGGRRWTFGEMIVGIVVHDMYHTGQIQLLKRLWRSRR